MVEWFFILTDNRTSSSI